MQANRTAKGKSLDLSDPGEQQLTEDIGSFFADPLGFVLYALPWGEPGTRLEHEDGPDVWQWQVLADVGRLIREGEISDVGQAIQYAVASGHGIGKTALVAWIILWFISTRPFPQIVVTANTSAQLKTKTWRELAKWWRLSINRHWFNWTATLFYHVSYPDTWFAAAVPWSEHNAEAFAGTHEEHVLVIFDEASAVADSIWETTDGAMTTPGAMWFAFGNPTRNTGRFAECFGKNKHRWYGRQIDSRTAKKADQRKLQEWVDDYGEDSDFIRVRVRGVFPRAGTNQLIGADVAWNARKREAEGWERWAKILSADIAREGDDQTVLTFRQGAKVHPQLRLRIPDLMEVASRIAEEADAWSYDVIVVECDGMGWGVYDRLKSLGYNVVPVRVGDKARDEAAYYNRRAELWNTMLGWLKEVGDIPDDQELADDLCGLEYGHDARERVQLERKKDMKKRGLASPDGADSLAVSFAYEVKQRGSMVTPDRPIDWRA